MKVLFCDVEGVWRIFAGRNYFVMQIQCGELLLKVCIVMRSQCGELLQECIDLRFGASMENCFRKVLFCDKEPVLRTVTGRYSLMKTTNSE